jgi:hypothetical protein
MFVDDDYENHSIQPSEGRSCKIGHEVKGALGPIMKEGDDDVLLLVKKMCQSNLESYMLESWEFVEKGRVYKPDLSLQYNKIVEFLHGNG